MFGNPKPQNFKAFVGKMIKADDIATFDSTIYYKNTYGKMMPTFILFAFNHKIEFS